jgi:hypothetical protein
MLYDVVDLVASVLDANFDADLTALCTAKGVATPTGIVGGTVRKREGLLAWATSPANLPGLGVTSQGAQTGAKNQAKRDSTVTVQAAYYSTGQDAALLGAHVELAAEAIMLSVDRMAGSGSGLVWGVAEGRDSVRIETMGTAFTRDANWFEDGVVVEFPANDRDVV